MTQAAPGSPAEPGPPDVPEPPGAPESRRDRGSARRGRLVPLGCLALMLAVLLGVVEGIGVAVAGSGQYAAATFLAQAVIVLTVVPVVLGVVAVVRGRGRACGLVAVVVGVLVNPFVLIFVLTLFGGS